MKINEDAYKEPAPKQEARLNYSDPIRPYWACLDGLRHCLFLKCRIDLQ